MQQEFAYDVAVSALAWLAGSPDLMGRFLDMSGTDPADIRARAGDADFLVSVLDFVTMDDAWVASFCEAAGFAYDVPLQARQALPGGAEMHWT